METTDAFRGFACRDCGAHVAIEDGSGRCPNCGGVLAADYDLDSIDADAFDPTIRTPDSMWDFDGLLPFSRADAVSLGEGATPLVECPRLADELGVERVLIKDEGGNPTGSVVDRGLSLALTAAVGAGAADVALPSAGDDGQSAAAYAGRAGLDAHVFVPSRSGFVQKAMINVHGGDMKVVEGRLPEAAAAYDDAMADAAADGLAWHSVAPFDTPFRHEALKTIFFEVVSALGEAPDAVVHPTGEGAGLVGTYEAATDLHDLGLIEAVPRCYAAQASGCAPIVRAVDGGTELEPWGRPDTICAGIEVPEPGGGDWAVEAVEGSDGGAVATEDPQILESAVTIAEHEGVSMSPEGGAAASGAWSLGERGAFESDDTVVLVNPATGTKTPDVLRSHLMGQGI